MLVTTVLLLFFICAVAASGDVVSMNNAADKADFSRLPRFYTSDPAYDEFVNEWFMRHLTVDDSGVYTGGVKLGIIDVLWTIEWDLWMLPWIDRGAMGLARQGGNPTDVLLTTLSSAVVDKYGYTWGCRVWLEPRNHLGGWVPTFGWPWPKYNRNHTVKRPTGWEFNDVADGARDEWIARDIDLEPGYVDYSLVGRIAGTKPEFLSPRFDCDAFQIPIIELDITYKRSSGEGLDRLVDGLKIYWTTDQAPRFSEDRMVAADFCDLPPKDFPQDHAPNVNKSEARYLLFFPMHLHPEWGREGRRITRLKIVPTGSGAEGVTVMLAFVRASYDVRLTTTNATLINATYKFYMWDRDDDFLAYQMPRLRRAMAFLNEHMKGRKEALLCTDWMVGKDGLGGDYIGHGQIGGYWDLLPSGRFDINSSGYYYYALRAMAELERVAIKRGIKVPGVEVLGPDNRTMLQYKETPESLDKLADRVKARIEKVFWNAQKQRFVRNIDVNGRQRDYGFLHHNVEALLFGVGTDEQRRAIVSWLNGRIVEGDTSTGADIYKWRFGPRFSTVQNEDYYFWPWVHDRRNYPEAARNYVFGQQYQNGGASPFTGLFDLMARCSTNDQAEIDKAFERTQEVGKWYADVKAAGGTGPEFYRKYYDGHPERGMQQSPNPGGLGLDHEFLSDASLGTEFLFYAFLGIDSTADGVIRIAPKIPTQLGKVGVTNVFYRGNYLTIEAGKGYVSLEGSKITNGNGLRAIVTIRGAKAGSYPVVDGKRWKQFTRGRDDTVTVITELRPVRIEMRGAGRL